MPVQLTSLVSSGFVGYTGSRGVQGIQGIQGITGQQGIQGTPGPGNTLTSTNDILTTALYPVMVGAAGLAQTPKTTETKFFFNASTGRVSATEFNATSDIAKKTDLDRLINALDTINQMNGYKFKWIENGEISYGVIAQEIEKLIPEIVDNSNEIKSVNYDAIIPFLIEAIKTLTQRVNDLEGKINE